ncbi:hypothetical protein [Enterococcus hirae]|uniref:hypothetical protein n=1 Tax=Enterococcus hirae TaxID=1354 RepID=UPI00136FFA50|nr:hypothetical protein [Enterococcus hirae]NAE18051.1 hypothetical protein [Enterococcus hirae]
MAGYATFTPDRAGWNALATGPEIRAVLESVMSRGQSFAEGISPRSTDEERAYFARRYGATPGPRYADSFEREIVVEDVGHRGYPRVEGILRNTAPHAAAVEFGNAMVANPAHVMAKTTDYMDGL